MIQGTQDWHTDRLSRFTSSRMGDLMKNGRGKDAGIGQTALTYIIDKAYEIMTGTPQGFTGNAATEWGHENEPLAIAEYSEKYGVTVDPIGFVCHPTNHRVGGSPDGLVGNDGIIEVKCPFNGAKHLNNVLTDAFVDDYEWQCHGNIWVTGRKWCDLISFDPRITNGKRLHVVRIERDEDKIAAMEARVNEATKLLEQYLEKLGYVEETGEW